MLRGLATTAAIVAASGSVPKAQAFDLHALLDRASVYEARFMARYSGLVAEETYVQRLPGDLRTIRSDYLLVKFPGARGWLGFRDVIDVDGQRVGRDATRLQRLFVEAPADVERRAGEISRAGARYNLADVGSLGHPLTTLAFVQQNYRPRFAFTDRGRRRSEGRLARRVEFEERLRPTLLRTSDGGDLPATGQLWIDEASGVVLETELEVGGGAGRAASTVRTVFRDDAQLGGYVPVEMRELHPTRRGTLRTVATYGRFRAFQVEAVSTVIVPRENR